MINNNIKNNNNNVLIAGATKNKGMGSKVFTISFPDKLLKRLDEYCNKYGGNKSRVLQMSFEEFIRRRERNVRK